MAHCLNVTVKVQKPKHDDFSHCAPSATTQARKLLQVFQKLETANMKHQISYYFLSGCLHLDRRDLVNSAVKQCYMILHAYHAAEGGQLQHIGLLWHFVNIDRHASVSDFYSDPKP